MKKLHSVKALTLLSVLAIGYLHANDCEGPLDRGSWYIMPKIGVDPTIFANRGFEQYIDPAAGIPQTCVVTSSEVGDSCRRLITTPTNVFQQSGCKSLKFGQLWSNGVLHVGFEVGRNTADNGQCFLEFFYDRANGKSACYNPLNTYAAPAGCTSDDCNTNCSTTSGSILRTTSRTDCLDKYVAYGAYIGHRHYFSRIWCDRFALFTGVKFGIQHRKAISVNATTPSYTATITESSVATTYTFAERALCQTYYCKSNAVSGSIQFGADYCINDCLTALVGVEVQATAPLKTNQNVVVALQDGSAAGTIVTGSGILVDQPTNFIPASTGTLVQFPVWVGLRWEFDFCKSSC